MVMMDNGNGSSKSRCGVFFLALGFALASMFQNICGNVVAGGVDLAGLWPRYINLRRGALITFVACWIVQPWQLINRAPTFILVLSSFSVFLAPIMGIMSADYYVLRHQAIRLTDLYNSHQGSYWYWHGFNFRVIVPWLIGWAPTVVGLISSVNTTIEVPKEMKQLYFLAFFYGFFVSAVSFILISKIWPPPETGAIDATDVFGAFTREEALSLGIEPLDEDGNTIEGLSEIYERPVDAYGEEKAEIKI
jgi:NCS1 family nucleobase:cation symporter-1